MIDFRRQRLDIGNALTSDQSLHVIICISVSTTLSHHVGITTASGARARGALVETGRKQFWTSYQTRLKLSPHVFEELVVSLSKQVSPLRSKAGRRKT